MATAPALALIPIMAFRVKLSMKLSRRLMMKLFTLMMGFMSAQNAIINSMHNLKQLNLALGSVMLLLAPNAEKDFPYDFRIVANRRFRDWILN